MRIFTEPRTSSGARAMAAAACVAVVAGCLEGDEPRNTSGIQIGALLPYTGELAAAGAGLEQGMILAVDSVNQAGGIAGRPLVLHVEDTHSDLGRARASAARLVGAGVSALLGPEEVALSRELAPTLGEHEIIMISGGISARDEKASEPSLWFRIFPSAKTVTAELASRMIEDGVHSTSLLYVDDGYGATFASFFTQKFTSLGGRVTSSVPMPASPSAVTLPPGKPDALVLIAYPRAGALAVQQLAAEGFSGRWYFGPSLDSEEFLLNTPPGILNGMVGLSPALTADSSNFAELFRDRWQGNEPSLGANFYYDSVAVVALALREAYARLGRQPSAKELAASVRSVSGPPGQTITWREIDVGLAAVAAGTKINYRGIAGPIDFDIDGNVAQGLIRFWHVQDGAIVRE